MNDTATDVAPAAPTPGAQPLVSVDDLRVRFVGRERTIDAVNGVSFALDAGEVLCILGESGSGKSVTLRAMMRLHPPHLTEMSGTVTVAGKDILGLGGSALSDLRGPEVAMIFQEPMTSLDPVFTIGTQIVETVMRHDGLSDSSATQARAGTARDGPDPVAGAPARRTIRTRCRAACASAP